MEPLLSAPVVIIDLEGLAEIGIGGAAPGERTVTSSAVGGSTHGAGMTGGKGATTSNGKGAAESRGAVKPTTVSSAGKSLGSGTPSGKAATRR